MKEYYSRRAREYERIYYRDDPVRQQELEQIKNELLSLYKNKRVLEAACGTGYWTEAISNTAGVVVAFDFSSEVIEIAKSKNLNAQFIVDDAYSMKNIKGVFNAGCANFWFSHIRKDRIEEFLTVFHNKLEPGSVVFMADNILIEGVGGKLITKPGDENTYKIRKLSDDSSYEVLKNYFSIDELSDIFKNYSSNLEINFGKCFWRVKYKTN
jgi:ubiquinone/menaquinone biosynthesis C-methylase UbiE